MLTVYNKSDLLKDEFIPLEHPSLVISAYNENDLATLLIKIEEQLTGDWQPYHLMLQPNQGKALHRLAKYSIIVKKYFDESTNMYVVEGYMPKKYPIEMITEGE